MVRIHRCPMQTFLAQIIPMVVDGYQSEVVYENHKKGYRFFKGEEEYIYFDIQE